MTVDALVPLSSEPPTRPKKGARIRWAFAACGGTLGIINSGLNFSLLIYYNQVLGLHASLAGLALAIALAIDAITDPLVGWWSDRTRSRWGRRHPFIYAALLPTALGYILLWFPPESLKADQTSLFGFLLFASVLVRIGMTLFDVPSNALIAELTADYEERTRLSSYKVSSAWITTNITGILLFAVWLSDEGGQPGSGLMRAEGYQDAGLAFSGGVICLMIIMLALLQTTLPWLATREHGSGTVRQSFATVMADLWANYTDRSILSVLTAAICLAAAMGMTSALWIYFMQFYFGLSSDGVNKVQLTYLAAAVSAILLLPHLCKGRDKRVLTLQVMGAFWLIDVLPYVLRTLGFFPTNGEPTLLWTLLVYSFFDGILINMLMALLMSMLADVVETRLLKTGLREEGMVLAGQTFVSKCSTALGTLLGGALLSIVNFPQVATSGIPPETLHALGAVYWGVMWALGVAAFLALRTYRIGKADHDAQVNELKKRGQL